MGIRQQCIAFDVGNSSLKVAVPRDEGWEVLLRTPTRPVETLGERLAPRLGRIASSLQSGALCVVSSVCPAADAPLTACWKEASLGGEPRFFGRDLPVPIPTLAREPAAIGTDRLLSALGARETVGAPCIVIGAGTAITVDLVDSEGRFAGGAIGPGYGLSARALHKGTACLPLVEPRVPERAVGLETAQAIRSGIHCFCKGGVCALIEQLRRDAGLGELPVVVTGGDAHLLLPLPVSAPVQSAPDLIFRGIEAALRSLP